MFKAIKKCQKSCLFKSSTKTQALRTIHDFERVNKITFDPFNRDHVEQIEGMGAVGGSIRSVRLKLSRIIHN